MHVAVSGATLCRKVCPANRESANSGPVHNTGRSMRPYVICHMVTSIDGKILGQRWGRLPRVGDSGKLFERTAASFGIDAWLVGNTTMKEFAGPPMRLPAASNPVDRKDHVADPGARG